MLKRFTLVALSISSIISLHPAAQAQTQAGDWAYPIPFRNYLSQLATESDWIREAPLGLQHYHFVSTAPLGSLIALANTSCAQIKLARPYETIKAGIEADTKKIFSPGVITKLGASGVSRFSDVAIKSAVQNTCPIYSNRLPQLNYTLPPN
jgi:hypothetical protein